MKSLSPAAFKKLKFNPGVIFVDETCLLHGEDHSKKVSRLQHLLDKLTMPYHVVRFEEILDLNNDQDPGLGAITSSFALKSFFDGIKTLTSKEELLYRLRCKLLAYKAHQFGYKHVFLGETSTRLAVNILANLAQGRGAHLASDTRFTDEGRYFGVNLLRPMRDISAKEIVVYNNLHKVETIIFPTFSTKLRPNASIQRLTEDFIVTLSADFPATETTVFRTSNKLEMAKSNKHDSICQLCHGRLDRSSSSASALKAIDFTEKLSRGDLGTPKDPQLACSSSCYDHAVIGEDNEFSGSTLCHCCKILKNDLPSETDESGIFKRISTRYKLTERELEEQLNGVLIQNE